MSDIPLRYLWVQRCGTGIDVRDMTDSHLANAIAMCLRGAEVARAESISAGYSVIGILQGEMAIDSVERDIDRLEGMTADEYLQSHSPRYVRLINERDRRNKRRISRRRPRAGRQRFEEPNHDPIVEQEKP